MRVRIEDDISKLPADRSAITDLHFWLVLSRLATKEPPKAIYECTNLRRLHLQAYGIERIDAGIGALTELRELIIGAPWSGHVRAVASEIGLLRKLEVLEFDSEDLATMPEAILDLTELRVLKWTAWQLKDVPDLSKLPKLHTLYLDVYTSGVPDFIRRMPQLRELRLRNARAHVPKWLWSLANLEGLGLDYVDQNSSLHFDAMPGLARVWLERSQRALPAGIASLPKLTHLEVAREVVPSIPLELLREGSPLEVLRIVDAKLRELPPTIARFTRLRELAVGKNLLKSIPEEIATLANLERLELGENTIHALPADIGRWRKLRHLDAHKNRITTVPPSIGALKELEVLDLSANRIASLPKELFSLSRMRSLSLANNLLPAVPAELAKLTLLEKLLLQNNPATKGSKNKAADALLASLAEARAKGEAGAASDDLPVALRARLQVADLEGARSLATGKDGPSKLIALLDDRDANVRARALGILGEIVPDPFKGSIEGRTVVFVGKAKSIKKAELAPLLAAAGAARGSAASTKGRIVVVGEKPGPLALERGDTLAALAHLERWMVRAKKPHLMNAKGRRETSDQLNELLTSRANENVALGLKLAEDGGVPAPLLSLVLAIGRAHGDPKIRKAATRAFERYAPPDLKLVVQNALGRVALTEGRDEKPVKAYAALAKARGFDVDTFAVEVARLSGLGVGYLFQAPPPIRERALRALLREGELAFTWRENIDALPEEIGSLGESLRSLRMVHTALSGLPASFAKLHALERVAFGNGLPEVPQVLAKLPALRSLEIGGQRFTTLDGIGQLVALEELTLGYVTHAMPNEIGRLVNLRKLVWHDYHEHRLSPSLAELARLEVLDVSGSAAESVPREIEPLLPRLKKLVIRLPKPALAALKAKHPALEVG